MSKLDEMIKELCPEGVEMVKLGDVCEILDNQRKPISKSKRTSGIYPYYGANGVQDYIDNYIFDGIYLLMGEDGSVINIDKSPILNWAEGKIWVNNHAHVLSERSDVALLRYLYYILQSTDVSDIVRGTPPKINQANLRDIEIPLPPLSIQQEIISVLDSFTTLIDKMKQEVEKRKKQMEYYREKLLTFKDGECEWKTLGELGHSFNGLTGKSKKDFEKGNSVFVTYSNIFNNPALNMDIPDRVMINEGEKQNVIQKGDILFTGSSETPEEAGMSSVVLKEPNENMYLNSFCFGLRLYNYDFVKPDYMKYLLRSKRIRDSISMTAFGVTRFNINKDKFFKVSIPIPSQKRQSSIVSTLDKFESYITKLEKMIVLRQKQYEYYREQLLTFR